MTCFWTSLVKCDQTCPPDGEQADSYVVITSGGAVFDLDDEELGITLPSYDDPVTINLLDLPGATYTLATTNKCGDAISLDLTDGVLSTVGEQNFGVCGGASPFDAVVIQAASFPFPANQDSLYYGRLCVGYGHGVSEGLSNIIYLNAVTDGETSGQVRYYSMTDGDVDSNSGYVNSADALGKIASDILGDGLVLQFAGAGAFQISTNFPLTIPPPAPTRWYAVVEEYWPIADNTGLGNKQFPLTEGTEDGVTSVPIYQDATGPTWNNPAATIGGLILRESDLESLDSGNLYKLGVYSGDDGYTNMQRVASLKLWWDEEGGGGL